MIESYIDVAMVVRTLLSFLFLVISFVLRG